MNQITEQEDRFGLIDVIEAFIAMRHESRNQTRESRELAESMQHTSTLIAELEKKLLVNVAKLVDAASQLTSDDCSQRLAETIVEIDKNVSRAVAALDNVNGQAARRRLDANEAERLKQSLREPFSGIGFLTRFFGSATLTRIERSLEQAVDRWGNEVVADDTTLDGLQMLVRRIRVLMTEQQIERIETKSAPFDAETMHALEAIAVDGQPRGHVIEQLSPAYRWRGKLLRFAEVRVSK